MVWLPCKHYIPLLQKALLTFTSFFVITIVNVFFNMLHLTNYQSGVTVNEVWKSFFCYGKMPLTFTQSCTGPPNLTSGNIIWSLIGGVLTTHKVVIETVFFLGILISCVVFLNATYDIERIEGANEFSLFTQTDLSNVTKLAEEISDYIGEVLLGYLMYNATITPRVFKGLFYDGAIGFVSGTINHGPIIVGLLISSMASKRVR